jgi:glycerol-3-phosphate acyltransferase PlsY
MPDWLLYSILLSSSYLLGSVPFGWLLVKIVKGADLRESGSGNIGATNAARLLGMPFFFLILALDAAKGALPAAAGLYYFENISLSSLMGVAAIIGHMFSVFLLFRGGKGVATGLGVFAVLMPIPLSAAVGMFLLLLAFFRIVSLASIIAAVALAAAFSIINEAKFTGIEVLAAVTFAVAALVIFKHRSNIKRLVEGKEPKIGGQKA